VDYHLSRSVSTICEDSLTSNPSTLGAEEPNNGRNVLNQSQTAAHSVGFVELDGFGGFLGVEES
jgi:hypothetical protein